MQILQPYQINQQRKLFMILSLKFQVTDISLHKIKSKHRVHDEISSTLPLLLEKVSPKGCLAQILSHP